MAGALGGALVTGSVTSAAQAVSTDQTYWVPANKQLTLQGHGFGHGHGMSQYGAEGAALKGLTYQQILDFYYPGTTWSTVTGNVRVLISADTTADVVVSPAGGLSVRDLGDGTTYPLPDITGVKRWRLNVAGTKTVVGYLTNAWHRWSPAGKDTLVGDGQFQAAGPLTLWTPAGSTVYRGALRAASPSPGSADRDTVNVLTMDQYVKGVIPQEMPASWQTEAVRAQAVAARTYATWSRSQYPTRYYQICDTSSCQVYGGASAEDPRSNAAVDATAKQILRYDGKPAFSQFSASNGGWTSAGSVPYLDAEKDPYDGYSGNPVHDWTATIDAGRLEQSYPKVGTLKKIGIVSRDGHGDWDGRVWSMELDGTKGTVSISGDSFRTLYGLRSAWFTFDPTPIIARWDNLGGSKSVLGGVRTAEYAVANGSQQQFAKGRIYYSRATGAHELYGPILSSYRAVHGPKSALAFPVTGIQQRRQGYRAKFQHGVIFSNARTGTVPVTGGIADRYLRYGGVHSDLGWPTGANTVTSSGERATFEHGTITWNKRTGRTAVTLTP
ncbi:MAG: SpoIID/LytB domain-containing protein [Nocardioidaceae bacterium]